MTKQKQIKICMQSYHYCMHQYSECLNANDEKEAKKWLDLCHDFLKERDLIDNENRQNF